MNAAAVFRRQRLLSPAARLGPRSVPRSFERLRPVPYEPRVAHCGAPYGYARFIWYGPEALEAPRPAAGAKTRSGRKEASPPKNGRCVHFSSMPGLSNQVYRRRSYQTLLIQGRYQSNEGKACYSISAYVKCTTQGAF